MVTMATKKGLHLNLNFVKIGFIVSELQRKKKHGDGPF